jgi:hypothetical protein
VVGEALVEAACRDGAFVTEEVNAIARRRVSGAQSDMSNKYERTRQVKRVFVPEDVRLERVMAR